GVGRSRPEEGWPIFDPTPPSGRPSEGREGTWPLLRQAWDFVEFRWDRYVLTFGLYDQIRIVGELHRLWRNFRSLFERPGAGAAAPPAPSAIASTPPGGPLANDPAARRTGGSP